MFDERAITQILLDYLPKSVDNEIITDASRSVSKQLETIMYALIRETAAQIKDYTQGV